MEVYMYILRLYETIARNYYIISFQNVSGFQSMPNREIKASSIKHVNWTARQHKAEQISKNGIQSKLNRSQQKNEYN